MFGKVESGRDSQELSLNTTEDHRQDQSQPGNFIVIAGHLAGPCAITYALIGQ